jgi:tRNA threonylcarbamoyladenosine biosynthesis protein TsaB
MELLIDTSNREKIIVGVGSKKFESESRTGASQELLPFIIKVLKKNNLELKDITEIKVATGPGSFTGLRVGVSVAQTLGWVLDIPVNGKSIKKGEVLEINYGQ